MLLGFAWLGCVAMELRFGPDFSLGFVWGAPNTAKNIASLAAYCLLAFLYFLFLLGWTVPLGLGIFYFKRQRRTE